MQLTPKERAMAEGASGEAAAMAMRIVAETGRIMGAVRLVPIASAHIDGCLYHGDSGVEFAETLVERALARIPEDTESRVLDACLAATGSSFGVIGVVDEHGSCEMTAYRGGAPEGGARSEGADLQASAGAAISAVVRMRESMGSVAGEASGVTDVMGCVVQGACLDVAGKRYDAQSQKCRKYHGQTGRGRF